MRPRHAATLLACALLAGCDRPRDIAARPALWRVADDDSTVWLLGTIHVLPREVNWRTPAVERAIAQSDSLLLEIAPPDAARAVALFGAAAAARGLPPILDRVAPARRAALSRAIDAAGGTPAAYDRLKSWAAAVTLTSAVDRARGHIRARGVEAVLADAFTGKPVNGFETLAGQFALFDSLPEAAQRVLLDQAIDNTLNVRSATFDAWAKGDTAALAATLAPGFAAAPVLEQRLVTRRNARWSRWIARRMDAPGRVLVAVGAGHLVGARSVVAMLCARGLRVTRVQ